MASKRPSHHEPNDDRDRQVPGKRRHGGADQAETSTTTLTMKEPLANAIALHLEPLLRKVVQEEVPPILQRYLTPQSPGRGLTLSRHTGTSGGRALQLRFMNKLPSTIFTFSNIAAEDGASLMIALCNTDTTTAAYQYRIVNEGPLSSTRIELCVLNGEFGSNGRSEEWTAQEFDAQTLRPREGKGLLLNGEHRFITLENGVGFITKLVFTDNSSWTRGRTFRLGVKIVQPNSTEADIREGRSEPFIVKDNRGESYKKHDRPLLNDEVWRLRMIAKNGKIHKQLSSYGIKTVKDLLQLYITNQTSLREKIGKIAGKSWDRIIEHAKACVIDDGTRYIYHHCAAQQSISIGLVFNCIHEVVEVTFDGQNYRPLESLNLEEKGLVERIKQHAYRNLGNLIPLQTLSAHGLVNPDQGQQGAWPYLRQPSTSTSHITISEAAHNEQIGSYQLAELGQMPLNSCSDGNGWPLSGSPIQYASTFIYENPFYLSYGDGAGCSNPSSFTNSSVYISSKGKRKTVWHKIRTALIFILRAAKRKAKLCRYPY